MSAAVDIRAVVVAASRQWIGTPYRHQQSRKGVGADCIGLVRGVWRDVYGIEPERTGAYTPDWGERGMAEPLIEAARRHCIEIEVGAMRAGDLILFRWRRHLPAKHAGILTGDGRFVHAYERHAVLEQALVPQWRWRIAAVFAFPPVFQKG